MELRTPAVDRLLEALSPSLTAELERILAESRQQLEAEFQPKLQDALRDAELATLHLAEVRLEEAVMEAREAMRIQLEEEFQSRLQTALRDAELATLHLAEVRLEEAVAEARETMRIQLTDSFAEQMHFAGQRLQEEMSAKTDEMIKSAFANWATERSSLQEQLSRWHTFAEAQRQLSQCTTQSEIVASLFKLSDPFAESFAFYISKPGGLSLWKSRGKRAFPPLVSPNTIDPDFYFKPAVVRNRVVAAVCAVRPCKVESLDFLMSCFERAIEAFGMKLQTRGPRPPAPEATRNAGEAFQNV